MPKKKVETPVVSAEVTSEVKKVETPKNTVFVRFMHLGKGKCVVKGFPGIDEAKVFTKTIQPWIEPGKGITYPELVVEPGLLEEIK